MRDEIRWWRVPVTFAFLWASVVGPPFALLPLLVAYWERHEYPTLGRSHRGDVRTGQEPTPSADRGPSRPGASARSRAYAAAGQWCSSTRSSPPGWMPSCAHLDYRYWHAVTQTDLAAWLPRCKSREEIENFAYGSFCSPQPQMKR